MHYVFACIYIFCEDEEKLPQKCTNRISAKNESFHLFLLPRLQCPQFSASVHAQYCKKCLVGRFVFFSEVSVM